MIGALALVLAQSATGTGGAADALRVVTLPGQVDFAAPFEVTVERRWPAAAAPPAWRDAWLAPLRVRTATREVREQDGFSLERRTLRAWAFLTGQLEVAGHALTVTGGLDPAAPGAMEVPAPPPATIPPLLRIARATAVLLLVAVAGLMARRARRRRVSPPKGAPGIEHLRAWARAPQLEDGGESLRAALDLCCLQCCGVDARTRTTQELLADPRIAGVAGAAGQAALDTLRQAADAARFAGQRSGDLDALAALALELAELFALPPSSMREVAA